MFYNILCDTIRNKFTYKEIGENMKIIRKGNPKQIKCSKCGSVLEYEVKDIHKQQVTMNEYGNYITCPVCENEIKLE